MFGKRLAIGLAFAIACCATVAHAADGTWIFGTGNGNWSDTTKWSGGTVADGTDFTAFFTAELTGTRTVTVDTPRTIGNITFTDPTPNNNLIIAGTGANILTLDRTGVGVSSPLIDVTQSTRTLQINAQISGDDGFTKTGPGILILNNNSNNYTGKTVVTGGVLQIGTAFNAGNLSVPGGYTGNPVTGSNLELNGGIVSYWYDFARTIGAGDGQIQLTGGRSGFTQKQGDRSGLTFGTAGSEIQWGSATFNPTILVLNDPAAGAANVISFNNALDFNGADRTIETASAALTGNTAAFARVIETGALLNYNVRNTSGTAAALIKTGAGKLALDGTNTYDGGTTINQGGVLFDLTASMPATGAVTVNDGTELIVSVGNAGEWTTGTSGVGTLGGLLAGDGGQTAAQVTYSGNVTVGVNTTTNQTYAGDIANVTGSTSTGLSVYADDGSGQLTLSGSNSYTGATKLYDGATLVAGSANALGSGGDISFVTGGALTYTAASAGNDYGSRITSSPSAISLNTNGQNVTLSGIAAGNTGGLTKSGSGILTLSGTNSFTGSVTVNTGGTLESTSSGALNNRPVQVDSGGTLLASGAIANLGTGDITNRGIVQWQVDGGGTITNRFTSIGRNANATFIFDRATSGAADNWTITPTGDNNGYFQAASGTTVTFEQGGNVTSGTSTVDITTGLHSSESITTAAITYVADGVNLLINGHTNTRGRNFTFSSNTDGNEIYGAINAQSSGDVSMTFAGTGTWNLSRAAGNGYEGGTTINGGTLLVTNTTGSGTGTGTVTVDAAGTLGGNGTISGATTINGFHAPGNSPGIQTFVGGLTYGSTSTLTWELIDNTVADRGINYDGVNVTGGSFQLVTGAEIDLTFSGSVDFLDSFWGTDQEWLVVDLLSTATAADTHLFAIGSITGGANYNPSLGTFGIERKAGSTSENAVYLTWVPVPEPASLALVACGGMIGFAILRRRR